MVVSVAKRSLVAKIKSSSVDRCRTENRTDFFLFDDTPGLERPLLCVRLGSFVELLILCQALEISSRKRFNGWLMRALAAATAAESLDSKVVGKSPISNFL